MLQAVPRTQLVSPMEWGRLRRSPVIALLPGGDSALVSIGDDMGVLAVRDRRHASHPYCVGGLLQSRHSPRRLEYRHRYDHRGRGRYWLR